MMKMKIAASVFLSALFQFTGLAADGVPAIACPLVTIGPTIDGRLKDSAWKTTPAYALVGPEREQDVAPQTRFRVCTDGNWLYLAIELSDSDAGSLSQDKRARDAIDWIETAEVFIAPDPARPMYYHFAVDPAGNLYDNIGMAGSTDNNFGWRCAVQVESNGWVAEIALPLKEIGLAKGVTEGMCLALNVCRSTRQGARFQSWSPTGSNFHCRDRFGTLVIGSLAAEAAKQLVAMEARFRALTARDDAKRSDPLEQEIAKDLAALRGRAPTVTNSAAWVGYQEALERAGQRIQRAAARGVERLDIWRCDPWRLPRRGTMAPEGDRLASLQVTALQGEYVSVALAVANPTDRPVRLRCVAEPLRLPDGEKAPAQTTPITLCRAEEVALLGGATQRDPLPVLQMEDTLVIQPAENEILWITLNTHGLAAGDWMTRIQLIPLKRYNLKSELLLTMRVLPASLPDGPLPYSCNWASYRYPPSGGEARWACREDQKRHFTSVHIVGAGDTGLRSLKFDKNGRQLNKPDFSLLDKEWLDVFGSQGQIYVLSVRYGNLYSEMDGKGNHAEREREIFTGFVRAIRKHLEQRGVGVKAFAWYITDEPDVPRAKKAAHLGDMLHAADPEQQMLATFYKSTPLEALRILLPYVNVWVPSFSATPEQFALIRAQGLPSRFLSYNVLSRTTPPQRYRRNGTMAWTLGYEGIGFWCYDDSGRKFASSTWTDLDPANPTDSRGTKRSDYSVIYEGSQAPVSSVRWEAWRHGIQDYRYLEWLTDLARRCGDKALAAEAKKAADEGAYAIINESDPALADRFNDRARDLALRLLVAIGDLSPELAKAAAVPMPLCLTDNDRFLAGAGLGGGYGYNSVPSGTHGESASTGQLIPFTAREGLAAGKLTDGDICYPKGWVIHSHPPDPWIVTFDLAATCRLDFVLVYLDTNPAVRNYKSLAVELSDTAEGGPWETVCKTDLSDILAALTKGNPMKVPLAGRRARFLRLVIGTCGETSRLGEVRIIGAPIAEGKGD